MTQIERCLQYHFPAVNSPLEDAMTHIEERLESATNSLLEYAMTHIERCLESATNSLLEDAMTHIEGRLRYAANSLLEEAMTHIEECLQFTSNSLLEVAMTHLTAAQKNDYDLMLLAVESREERFSDETLINIVAGEIKDNFFASKIISNQIDNLSDWVIANDINKPLHYIDINEKLVGDMEFLQDLQHRILISESSQL